MSEKITTTVTLATETIESTINVAERGPTGATGPAGADGAPGTSIPGSAAAVWVGKHGSDSNTGLAIDKPKLTIGAAIVAASALISAGASGVRVEVMDGATYAENITVPASVFVNASGAQLNGTVTITAGAEVHLDRHFATANNQNMVTMGDAASGPAIYTVHVIDGRGTGGTLKGVQCVRNIGGGGKNLFVRAGIVFVGEEGVGLGDSSSGFGHIHIEVEDLYLAGLNAIGIQAGASGANVANMVGVIHHILEFGSPNGCTGIRMTNAAATVKLVCAEIIAQTAYNITSGSLYLTCPRVSGTQTGTPTAELSNLRIHATNIKISGFPTSNPGPGILWNDSGTIRIGT
jgi:hypothetical protein